MNRLTKLVKLALVVTGIAVFPAQALAVKPVATITGVKAQQRYPWNGKVDIEYTVSELTAAAKAKDEMPFLTIMAIDRDATPWTTNYADLACLSIGPAGKEAYTDAVATADGTHQIVWDLDKQKLALVSTNVVFAVLGDGGVQLWENGPYWATCNVGASKPEECGYYFWWGDAYGYKRNADNSGWVSVKDGSEYSFEGCPVQGLSPSELLSEGYIDNNGNLTAAHDAATEHLGGAWRTPTAEELWQLDECKWEWFSDWNGTGMAGYLVTGKDAYCSMSIFLPAAGGGSGSDYSFVGTGGGYWTSTPYNKAKPENAGHAYGLDFDSKTHETTEFRGVRYGMSVRPVRGFAK